MNKSTRTSQAALWIAATAAIATTALSAPAYAEYRCATPARLSNEEKRACELARQDTADALIHFVNTTKGIYNLYVNNYISKADLERWELARRKGAPDSPPVAKAGNNTNDASKAH